MNSTPETSPPKSDEIILPLQPRSVLLADGPHPGENDDSSPEQSTYLTIKSLENQPSGTSTWPDSESDVEAGHKVDVEVTHATFLDEPPSASRKKKTVRRVLVAVRLLSLLPILYFFVCSLDLLTSGFQLLAGRAAGDLFSKSSLLRNPIAGLMIGVLVTVLVQSSSTTTSIIVSMVSAGIIPVKYSIPMIMGANIGTSTTNTLVALGQIGVPKEFQLAFSGATVHDVFNWLNVIVQLPLEAATGFLYKLTSLMVKNINGTSNSSDPQFLSKITKPLTNSIIQINKTVVEYVAQNVSLPANTTMRLLWCGEEVIHNSTENGTITQLIPCKYLLRNLRWPDWGIGILLTIISLIGLILCLMLMVKTLRFLLEGHISKILRRTIDKDFPGIFRHLTPYVFLLIGIGCTILVQSSSVFTSVLTPLVGTGVVSIERMYPLTLGSNVGTTVTAIISALAATSVQKLRNSLQAALAHLFFNVIGILLFFVVPPTRKVPIAVAKFFGKETVKYRWFAPFYLVTAFLLLPGLLLGISVAGTVYAAVVFGAGLLIVVTIVLLNYMMKRHPKFLPKWLRSWRWLPEPLRSLAPYDRLLKRVNTVSRTWISKGLIRPDTSVTSMTKLFRHKENH